MSAIQNRLFEEIQVGDTASVQRVVQARDVRAWSAAFGAGGVLVEAGATQDTAGIVTAMLTSLVGSALPGPGASVRACAVQVRAALPVNAVVTVRLAVTEKRPEGALLIIAGSCLDAAAQSVATAVLEVVAPAERLRREVPEHRLEGLLQRCGRLAPILTGVVYPCSAESLRGALEAAEAGLIVPVLYGPEAQLRRIAAEEQLDLSGCRLVEAACAEEAATQAALAAGRCQLQALMKGSLHTDVLLHAVMRKEARLRRGRLLSHCAIMSVPTYARRIVITDAALNIAPDTDQKRAICQNAIGFARALGIDLPKVAVLAAVETVHTRMPASVDAAILAKMADRRQIGGAVVDGPLDLDAAVDPAAALTKQIDSPVAGLADVLLAPNIEAANMIYKDLGFMADAQSAGLVVGARVPLILTSRADTAVARRFSAAASVLYADALARDPAGILPEPSE